MQEIDQVAGGDAIAVAFWGGAATSVAIGASLGPVGMAVAFGAYSASFGITYMVVSA
jgi:hypothetical protein